MAYQRPLTAKQEAFCVQYALLGSGSAAYKIAYDSHANPNSLAVQASRTLKHPAIVKRIEELRAGSYDVLSLSVSDVLSKLWALACEAKRDSDRIRALELCGRHLAMFTDKIRIESGDDDLRRACEAAGLDPALVLREVDAILGEAK